MKCTRVQGELTCSASSCEDERAYSILEDIIKMAADDDLNPPEIRSLEVEESQVSTVTFVGGPVVARPAEGWTLATATAFCLDYFESSSAVGGCTGIPGVDVNTARTYCTDDVLVSIPFS